MMDKTVDLEKIISLLKKSGKTVTKLSRLGRLE
jgi:hypothetical protein